MSTIKIKRALVVIISIVMAVSLFACGNDNTANDMSSQSDTATNERFDNVSAEQETSALTESESTVTVETVFETNSADYDSESSETETVETSETEVSETHPLEASETETETEIETETAEEISDATESETEDISTEQTVTTETETTEPETTEPETTEPETTEPEKPAETEPAYTRDGNYIYFGEYPQTVKSDEVTITETTDSRGYYLGSDGEYYAMVTAVPYQSSYKFSTNATISANAVFYFKVEPIKWRILSENNGSALLLCDSIIDSKAFDESSNNYAQSDIRSWLNSEFNNIAFNKYQQEFITATEVDNSSESSGTPAPNPFACENTNDKLFLLSYIEATNTSYGFNSSYSSDSNRMLMTSDYSRAVGAWISTSPTSYGYGNWWLRSPYDLANNWALGIGNNGGRFSDSVNVSNKGIAPSLVITFEQS